MTEHEWPEPNWYYGMDEDGFHYLYTKDEVRPSQHSTAFYTAEQVREIVAVETAELKRQLENHRTHIHTCGPTCTKAGCVNQRLRDDNERAVQLMRKMLKQMHDAFCDGYMEDAYHQVMEDAEKWLKEQK